MSSGTICKCGHPMIYTNNYPIYDHLNNNHFVDLEFYCGQCGKFKYIRCVENNILKIDDYTDYKPCMERREILQ